MSYDTAYDPDTDFDAWYTRGTALAIGRRIKPGQTVLELGCATGAMTSALLAAGAHVTAVDWSEPYLQRARKRAPDATFLCADITELDLGCRFDHVAAANVAHEVPDLLRFLTVCRDHARGLVHLTVPNQRSLHRLLGRAMGLIGSLDATSERGERYGTLRLLDVARLTIAAGAAGLECVEREGIMVKPLPNDAMAALPDAVLEGFLALAPDLPEHCAMTYMVLERDR